MSHLQDLLFRDVKEENESNRTAFILRLCSLAMLPYYCIVLVLYLLAHLPAVSIGGLLCLAGYIVVITLTYQEKNHSASVLFCTVTGVWITLSVLAGGWGQGSAYLWFVLLLFLFATSHRLVRFKVLQAAVLYAGGYALYLYSEYHSPWVELGKLQKEVLEGFNTAVAFADMVIIMTIFASATIAAESKLEKYNEKLKMLAGMDSLTQMMNRRSMTYFITRKVMRDKTVAACMAMGDIDFFKKINDTYGHEAGDKVLEEVSAVMRSFMKDKGTVARWGGEEFLFYFDEGNLDIAGVWMRNLLDEIRGSKIMYSDMEIGITMTFGVVDTVFCGKDEETICGELDRTIAEADRKLYMGKQNGRNKVVL